MDPNKTLANIRALALDIRRGWHFSPGELCEFGEELASAIIDLDEWLTKGGFLPADWNTTTQAASD